jgi:hypothetical protein
MSRVPLVIGGVVVLAAGVALVFLLRSDKEHPATPANGSASSEHVTAAPHTPPPRDPSVVVTDKPRLPGENPQAGEAPPTEYAVGDVRVRDHRAGEHAPMDIPPNVHPAEGRMLPSELTFAISQKVKAVMNDCVAGNREGRGEKPRLEGQLIVGIKDHALSVTGSTMQLRDMEGPVVDTLKQCIESKSIGQTTPAPEQADLEGYSIHITFAIP